MVVLPILARVRIPIPAELAGPIAVVGGIFLLIFAIWFLSVWLRERQAGGEPTVSRPRIEKQALTRMCLAALAALVLADVIFALLTGPRPDGRHLRMELAHSIVLVAAAALLWRLGLWGAALAAVVYGLFAPPLGSLIAVGRPLLSARPAVAAFLWAICVLAGLALAVPRLKPIALGVFVGAAAGCLVGRLLSLLIGDALALMPLMWAVAYALILGGLLALAASVVKPSTVG